jgi:anti-sigma B factor antagonist
MELRSSQNAHGTVITVVGELDLYNAFKLKELTVKTLGEGARALIINLDAVKYIDSSGIGAVIHSFAQCRSRKTPFFVTNLHGTVRKVIEMTKLIGFLPIAETEEEAIGKLAAAT